MSITTKTQPPSENCDDLTGSFQFDFDGYDRVITFSQVCHSNPALSMRGTIRYVAYESRMATYTQPK